MFVDLSGNGNLIHNPLYNWKQERSKAWQSPDLVENSLKTIQRTAKLNQFQIHYISTFDVSKEASE